jgi:hypothetical protein
MKVLYLTIFTCAFFLSACNKDCETAPLLLPAIQKVREAASRQWQKEKGTLQKMQIPYSVKLQPEYSNFLQDTNIVVVCRIKLPGSNTSQLLPYQYTTADGTLHSFFCIPGKEEVNLYYQSSSASASPQPIEQLSLNFTKISY